MTQRRVQTNFTAGSGMPPRDAEWSAAPEQYERVAEEPRTRNGVPVGTVREVLGWVGADKVRAEQALAVEQGTADPRKGLVAALLKVAGIKPQKPAEPAVPVVAEQPVLPPPAPAIPVVAPQPFSEPQ